MHVASRMARWPPQGLVVCCSSCALSIVCVTECAMRQLGITSDDAAIAPAAPGNVRSGRAPGTVWQLNSTAGPAVGFGASRGGRVHVRPDAVGQSCLTAQLGARLCPRIRCTKSSTCPRAPSEILNALNAFSVGKGLTRPVCVPGLEWITGLRPWLRVDYWITALA